MAKKADVRVKLLALMDEMNDNLVERRDEVEGLAISLLSRNHAYFLGLAGVGKGKLIDTFIGQIKGASLFDILMAKDTIADEVFGPQKLSQLKKDIYERQVDGFLPTANVAFIDEGFKANSVVLNKMLKVMNERKFLNGNTMLDVPLESLYLASNELPEDLEEGDGTLMAMYDRIVLRYVVEDIEDSGNYLKVMKKLAKPVTTVITLDEIKLAQIEVQNIIVPDKVLMSLWNIKRHLKPKGFYISQRKLVWIQEIIRAKAWLAGKTEADISDLLIVRHCLWDTPSQIKDVRNVVTEIAEPQLKKAEDIRDGVWQIRNEIDNEDNEARKLKLCEDNLGKVTARRRELEDLKKKFDKEGRDTYSLDDVIVEVAGIRRYIKDLYVSLDG